MHRPDMPPDLVEARISREAAIKIEMEKSIRIKVFAELFAVGPIVEIDLALGVDRKRVLKEVLAELAGSLDDYKVEYPENMH